MSEIKRLLEQYEKLCDEAENRQRLSLWETTDCGLRGDAQWHAIPNYTTESGRPMPVTVECMEKTLVKVLGMDLTRFYTDPDYFLEFYLRCKILKYHCFEDDTPLTREIPVCFGITHEAGLLGQKVILLPGEEPQLANDPIINENSEIPDKIDFSCNEYLDMVIPYYQRVKALAGSEFRVIFPQWYRGPQGVALYVRGFQAFSIDMYVNKSFAHRLLHYVTRMAIQFALWRQEYTGEPVARCDLFNDDIPLMSPASYTEFFLPCEQELSDFHGGIWYWHSCGDITKHIPKVHSLSGIQLLDFGVSMENKTRGIQNFALFDSVPDGPRAIELRVMAKPHIQEANEEDQKAYVRGIIESCRENGIRRYVLRSSGMSVLLGGERDLSRLSRWIKLVRQVQAER